MHKETQAMTVYAVGAWLHGGSLAAIANFDVFIFGRDSEQNFNTRWQNIWHRLAMHAWAAHDSFCFVYI
jgi:hypothetical protein